MRERGTLGLGDDARAELAADANERRAPLGAFERRAHRLQLRYLGIAELSGHEDRPVLPEQQDHRDRCDRDDRDEQQREPAEQRAGSERHRDSPAPGSAASGT